MLQCADVLNDGNHVPTLHRWTLESQSGWTAPSFNTSYTTPHSTQDDMCKIHTYIHPHITPTHITQHTYNTHVCTCTRLRCVSGRWSRCSIRITWLLARLRMVSCLREDTPWMCWMVLSALDIKDQHTSAHHKYHPLPQTGLCPCHCVSWFTPQTTVFLH